MADQKESLLKIYQDMHGIQCVAKPCRVVPVREAPHVGESTVCFISSYGHDLVGAWFMLEEDFGDAYEYNTESQELILFHHKQYIAIDMKCVTYLNAEARHSITLDRQGSAIHWINHNEREVTIKWEQDDYDNTFIAKLLLTKDLWETLLNVMADTAAVKNYYTRQML